MQIYLSFFGTIVLADLSVNGKVDRVDLSTWAGRRFRAWSLSDFSVNGKVGVHSPVDKQR